MKLMSGLLSFVLGITLSLLSTSATHAELPAWLDVDHFPARDSLDVTPDAEPETEECRRGLIWQPTTFEVTCESASEDRGDLLVRFASPISTGNDVNDRVAMEWYVATDAESQPMRAPAVVVVHESGRGMVVGRLCAKGLREQGLHTFLIHLPYYGERRGEGRPDDAQRIFEVFRQGIADVRRARDAVAVLPFVDTDHIALQGTSLGGFVSATCGGIDSGYDSLFLLLAGGNLFEMLQHGKRDAAKAREKLAAAGITGERLRALTRGIEPNRLAHRLRPECTWLYSGEYDTVVPIDNAVSLASTAGLDPTHHIRLSADHYSGIVFLPFILRHIPEQIMTIHDGTGDTQD